MAARIKTIKKAQKPQGNCQKCGVTIAVGDPYRYFKVGFRSRTKNVRCMKNECSPRLSEMTASKMSGAYAAQESAEDALAGWQPAFGEDADLTDLKSILEQCAQEANDVLSEYQEALDAAPMLEDQVRPNMDAIESWVSELDSASDLSEWEGSTDEDEQCEHCGGDGNCDITENDEAGPDDACSDCNATKNAPTCGNCDGAGTVENTEGPDEAAWDEWVEEQRGIASDLINSLEA